MGAGEVLWGNAAERSPQPQHSPTLPILRPTFSSLDQLHSLNYKGDMGAENDLWKKTTGRVLGTVPESGQEAAFPGHSKVDIADDNGNSRSQCLWTFPKYQAQRHPFLRAALLVEQCPGPKLEHGLCV